jgi:hypothetical protein
VHIAKNAIFFAMFFADFFAKNVKKACELVKNGNNCLLN